MVDENEIELINIEWDTFQKTQGEWAAKQFPDQTSDNKLLHAIKEIHEIRENPDDIYEYADAISLILDAARLHNITSYEILQAAWVKLNINMKRKWVKNPDGTYSGSKI